MTEKIIRRPDYVSGPITDEERVKLEAHSQMWIKRAFRTDPIEPDKIKPAIIGLYNAAGLAEPIVGTVSSPLVMALAGGFAAGFWHLRGQNSADAKGLAAVREATKIAIEKNLEGGYDNVINAVFLAIGQEPKAIKGKANKEITKFLLRCANYWWRMYQGGNMWCAYECYLTALRDVIGLRLKEHEKYAFWEQAAIHGGFRVMHEKFCLVSDFPDFIGVDEMSRPHNDQGPSHHWRDGWSLYHVHGVRVPNWVVETPGVITVEAIDKESNAEVRRVMVERYGVDRYLTDSKAEIVHEDKDIHGLPRQLWRSRKHGADAIMAVSVLNSTAEPDGTRRRYFLMVDPELRPIPDPENPTDEWGEPQDLTCLNAVASTFGMRGEDYKTSIET